MATITTDTGCEWNSPAEEVPEDTAAAVEAAIVTVGVALGIEEIAVLPPGAPSFGSWLPGCLLPVRGRT